jgi:two-component system response regulator FixJ
VDDDPAMLESIAFVLNQAGLKTVQFNDPKELLVSSDKKEIGCVVADLSMPSMTGIELIRELRLRNFQKPVIFLTGCGSVSTAVEAMKLDAFDYLEKPVQHTELLSSVSRALESAAQRSHAAEKQEDFGEKLRSLTKREREIIDLVADGLPSKQIATRLGISIKTVDVHRSHLSKKLGVRSIAELVRCLTIYRLENEAM